MGYTTTFEGELKFTGELTNKDMATLSKILGEDRRYHPEWNAPDDFYYVDLELTDDFSGLKWSGAEKSYGMIVQVETVIRLMRESVPTFGLAGVLRAKGEDFDDVWELHADESGVTKFDPPKLGDVVQCPHCEGKFRIGNK